MIHIVDMLSHCKKSHYIIKKILKFFTEDFTATETSKQLNLNRKTINRYYNIFRKIILKLNTKSLKFDPNSVDYIGWIKGTYGYKCYFKIYKQDEKTFFCTKIPEKPNSKKLATEDDDFSKYLSFIYERFSKFHGLSGKTYFYQLFESSAKYKYTKNYLFNLIWKQLLKDQKKE